MCLEKNNFNEGEPMKIMLLDYNWSQTGYLIAHLAEAGFDIILVSPGPFDPFGLGHYCRHIDLPGSGDVVPFLTNLLTTEKVDIVFPLCEDFQRILWGFPEELTKNVFPLMNDLQRQVLSDRASMYELASSLGIPVPPSMALLDEQDLPKVVDQFGFPFILRGTQGMAGMQVKIIHTIEEGVSAYRELLRDSPGPPFAQAYINGTRHLLGALFVEGQMVQWYSQTTLESFPSPTGPSIRLKTFQDSNMTGYAEKIFNKLNWTGLACAEFMRNNQGQFFYLEINPRPWAAIQVASLCGMPLLKSFCEYLLGETPAKQNDFTVNMEVSLFPQYFNQKRNSGNFPCWSDGRYYLQSLLGAPWRYPYLIMHYLRLFWWGRK